MKSTIQANIWSWPAKPLPTIAVLVLLRIGCGVLPAAAQQDEVRLRIQANIAPRIDIAVQPFAPVTKPHSAVGDTITNVLIRDLKLSGVFNVVDLSVTARTANAGRVPVFVDRTGNVDYDLLRKTAAQTLVTGEYEVREPQIEMTLKIVDVKTRKTVTTRGYAAFGMTLRRVIHRMADDVVFQMTGEQGIAQTRVAFISDRTGHKEVYIADYDGFNVQQLTNDGARKFSPQWSPDGTRIVYTSFRDGPMEMYVLNLQTGETRKYPTYKNTVFSPRWSPDGRHIVFGLSIEGTAKLYLMNADGTGLRALHMPYGIAVEPSWSPAGDQIAYVSDRTNDPHVYVVNMDGSNDRRITWDGTYNASPAWSPKGDRIAFVAGDTLRTAQGDLNRIFNIYTCDVNGENLMRLTGVKNFEGNNENPSWSPDGRHILFSSDRRQPGQADLYIMNWDGADVYRIVTGGDNITPSWGPRP